MFKTLINEATLSFNLKTESPMFIKDGSNYSLDPTATDNTYITTFVDKIPTPYIPGTSIKGVFRSRAEKLLEGSCNIVSRQECVRKDQVKNKDGKERYKMVCPTCKLFGSKIIKSRISFSDALAKGHYSKGKRTCVGIDRITGAPKKGLLYDMEYITDAAFFERINIVNFYKWHIKLILNILEDVDEGFVTFGAMTSKGFGRMNIEDVALKLRYYYKNNNINKYYKGKGYRDKGFYYEKDIIGMGSIKEALKNIELSEKFIKDGEFNEQAL